jgi:hypothetical protein
VRGASIPTMSREAIDRVRQLEEETLQMPQVDIATHHVIHGGLYARTICVPAGVLLTGAEIKRPTVLIVSGHAHVTLDGDTVRLEGYHVLPASAGRKQAFLAVEDTMLTMLFPTCAQSVEEAEAQFTDDADRLMSRTGENTVVITGE